MQENDWAVFMLPSTEWAKFRAESFYNYVEKDEKCQLIRHDDGPLSIISVWAKQETITSLWVGLTAFEAKTGFKPCHMIDKTGPHWSSGSLFDATNTVRYIEEIYLKHKNIALLKERKYKIVEQGSLDFWLGKRGRRSEEYVWHRPDWLDHQYFLEYIETGEKKLVGEPYDVSLGDLREIIAFCDKYNLDFEISHAFPAIHYPNHTTALVFSKIKSGELSSTCSESSCEVACESAPIDKMETFSAWPNVTWISKEVGNEEAVGHGSLMNLKHHAQGEGYNETHLIELKTQCDEPPYFFKLPRGSWEFSEFQNFVSELDGRQSKPILSTTGETSRSLYSVLDEAATEEGVSLSVSLREKLSQILVECCQDFFKDWKDKLDLPELPPEKIKSVIIENFERVREWQRWSEQEINDLFYLWKIRQMKVEKIARLMQRSAGSVERMIAFIESDKYMNYANFYKDIKTKISDELEGKK